MGQRLSINGEKKTVPDGLKIRWPLITQQDKDAVMKVLDSQVLGGLYAPQAVGLEEDFANYIGTKYCLTVNSGTAALQVALAATGIGPGDEVISPAFSFLATAVACLHQNAIPVFVDIDPRTFNIDASRIEEKITSKTRAIVPVHIHGLPVEMDEIKRIAKKHNLIVIEDAAQAQGAVYKGKKTGNFGDMACYSLNFTKNLPGGEGGLIVTNSKEYYDRANMIRCFGEKVESDATRDYNALILGYNYRTQEMPAAFTRSQLKRLDENNKNAQRNAEYLTKTLNGLKGVHPPYVPSDRTHIYHKYRIKLDPSVIDSNLHPKRFRDTIRKTLNAEGVDAVLWQDAPVPEQTLFQSKEGYGKGCPWRCEHAKDIEYASEDYPETQGLLDNSLVIYSEVNPIYCQSLELTKYYGEAFQKVFNNLEQLEF